MKQPISKHVISVSLRTVRAMLKQVAAGKDVDEICLSLNVTMQQFIATGLLFLGALRLVEMQDATASKKAAKKKRPAKGRTKRGRK